MTLGIIGGYKLPKNNRNWVNLPTQVDVLFRFHFRAFFRFSKLILSKIGSGNIHRETNIHQTTARRGVINGRRIVN